MLCCPPRPRRYELDQEYKAHWDVIETKNDSTLGFSHAENPRTATLLMYLSGAVGVGGAGRNRGCWES